MSVLDAVPSLEAATVKWDSVGWTEHSIFRPKCIECGVEDPEDPAEALAAELEQRLAAA